MLATAERWRRDGALKVSWAKPRARRDLWGLNHGGGFGGAAGVRGEDASAAHEAIMIRAVALRVPDYGCDNPPVFLCGGSGFLDSGIS